MFYVLVSLQMVYKHKVANEHSGVLYVVEMDVSFVDRRHKFDNRKFSQNEIIFQVIDIRFRKCASIKRIS